jgi:hypothetical protein
MIYDDCDCDILAPIQTHQKLVHIKCKIIKLMDDQMRKAGLYIQDMTKAKSRFTRLEFLSDPELPKMLIFRFGFWSKLQNPYYYYFLLILLLLTAIIVVLVVGAFIGIRLCRRDVTPDGYGVF